MIVTSNVILEAHVTASKDEEKRNKMAWAGMTKGVSFMPSGSIEFVLSKNQ
jgi:hypothetical protein